MVSRNLLVQWRRRSKSKILQGIVRARAGCQQQGAHLSATPHAELVESNRSVRSNNSRDTTVSFSPPSTSKISPHQTLAAATTGHAAAADATGRASRGDLPPPPSGRARVPRARLARQQALAWPPLRPCLPRPVRRAPWSCPHARLPFVLDTVGRQGETPRPRPTFRPTKFGPRVPDWGHMAYDSLDCRHGRVLLADDSVGFSDLAVWDPMTGYWKAMEVPDGCIGLGAAVLCAVAGCEHISCHEGPFQVLLFGLSTNDGGGSAHAWVCSSEAEEWSEPCSPLQLGSVNALIQPRPSLLFENALYHTLLYPDHIAILKYDIGSNCMSLLDGPPLPRVAELPILMAMDDDSLGFTYFDCFTLYRISRQIRSDGVATWTKRIVVDLKDLLPFQNPKNGFRLVGFKEDSAIIFVTTDLGIYEINLNSLEWKKLWKRENIRALIPYMSFYDPPERATNPSKTAH